MSKENYIDYNIGDIVQINDNNKFNSLWRSKYCIIKHEYEAYYTLNVLGTSRVAYFRSHDFKKKRIQLNRGI